MSKQMQTEALLKEATQLLQDIALKGDVFGDHVQRASEFVAKATNRASNEELPKAA